MFVLMFLLILLVLGVGFLTTKIGIKININALESFLNHIGLILLVLISAFLYFISYKISYKIIKNKDY